MCLDIVRNRSRVYFGKENCSMSNYRYLFVCLRKTLKGIHQEKITLDDLARGLFYLDHPRSYVLGEDPALLARAVLGVDRERSRAVSTILQNALRIAGSEKEQGVSTRIIWLDSGVHRINSLVNLLNVNGYKTEPGAKIWRWKKQPIWRFKLWLWWRNFPFVVIG